MSHNRLPEDIISNSNRGEKTTLSTLMELRLYLEMGNKLISDHNQGDLLDRKITTANLS